MCGPTSRGRDAEAIAEAASRPTMRFVALKTEAQLEVQVLHRVRDRLRRPAASLMNQVRSLAFSGGRDLAAWMGLVPRQVTTGGRRRLLGITKRGSKYLRKLALVTHCAPAFTRPGTQPCREYLAVPSRQLALQPRLRTTRTSSIPPRTPGETKLIAQPKPSLVCSRTKARG